MKLNTPFKVSNKYFTRYAIARMPTLSRDVVVEFLKTDPEDELIHVGDLHLVRPTWFESTKREITYIKTVKFTDQFNTGLMAQMQEFIETAEWTEIVGWRCTGIVNLNKVYDELTAELYYY